MAPCPSPTLAVSLLTDWPLTCPALTPLPAPREFTTLFSPVADHLTLYLAIPIGLSDQQNTTLPNAASTKASSVRFQAAERLLPDQNTGLDEKLIQLGQKNLQLLAEGELTERVVSLPIVRILRDGSGHYESDPSFVPPCLTTSASSTLTDMLRRLIEILDEKSTIFTQEQQQRNGVFQAGMSARDVAHYWFLHALNSNVSALRHILLSRHIHPQELFREMSRLGGALCTFGLEVHPRSLPAYDHQSLGTQFAALDDHIRRHLEIVMPSKAIRIPLKSVESFLIKVRCKTSAASVRPVGFSRSSLRSARPTSSRSPQSSPRCVPPALSSN